MKRITKIDAAAKTEKKLRVAAYARVSTDSADQLVSLDAQKESYDQVITYCLSWEYDGVCNSEGVSARVMRSAAVTVHVSCIRMILSKV